VRPDSSEFWRPALCLNDRVGVRLHGRGGKF
jgi:hypothetical protein